MTIIERLRQAQRRRQAARQLRALPPELLSDIGIEPDRIDEAVASMAAAHGVGMHTAVLRVPGGLHPALSTRCGAPYPRS